MVETKDCLLAKWKEEAGMVRLEMILTVSSYLLHAKVGEWEGKEEVWCFCV